MVQSTSREPVEGGEALALLEGVRDLYVAKGKEVLHFDLSTQRPPDEELLALMLGRSGKLRAPAMRAGTTFVVGYNGEILRRALG